MGYKVPILDADNVTRGPNKDGDGPNVFSEADRIYMKERLDRLKRPVPSTAFEDCVNADKKQDTHVSFTEESILSLRELCGIPKTDKEKIRVIIKE